MKKTYTREFFKDFKLHFENLTRACFFQIALETILLPIQIPQPPQDCPLSKSTKTKDDGLSRKNDDKNSHAPDCSVASCAYPPVNSLKESCNLDMQIDLTQEDYLSSKSIIISSDEISQKSDDKNCKADNYSENPGAHFTVNLTNENSDINMQTSVSAGMLAWQIKSEE